MDEARQLILEREQYYLETLSPEYNILKLAGSSLGYKYTEETIAKISAAKSGENHYMCGKTHSEETLLKMSEAKSNENHPRGMKRKTHSAGGPTVPPAGCHRPPVGLKLLQKLVQLEVLLSMFILWINLLNNFSSASKAAKHFYVEKDTVLRYARNNLIFKEQWFFSTSLITKEEENS